MKRKNADAHLSVYRKRIKNIITPLIDDQKDNEIFSNKENLDALKWYVLYTDDGYQLLKGIFEDDTFDTCLPYLKILDTGALFKVLYCFYNTQEHCVIYCLLKLMKNKQNIKEIQRRAIDHNDFIQAINTNVISKLKDIKDKIETNVKNKALTVVPSYINNLGNELSNIVKSTWLKTEKKFIDRLGLLISIVSNIHNWREHDNMIFPNNQEGYENYVIEMNNMKHDEAIDISNTERYINSMDSVETYMK